MSWKSIFKINFSCLLNDCHHIKFRKNPKNRLCKSFIFLYSWVQKYFIYPTLSEIWIFLENPNCPEESSRFIEKICVDFGPKNDSFTRFSVQDFFLKIPNSHFKSLFNVCHQVQFQEKFTNRLKENFENVDFRLYQMGQVIQSIRF